MVSREQTVKVVEILSDHDVPVIAAYHLADATGISIDEAEEILDELVDDGVLESWKGKADTTVYTIDESY